MEHLLFAPKVLGAGKDVKRGSESSVSEESPFGSSGAAREGEAGIASGKSPLELLRHLPGQTELYVVGKREGHTDRKSHSGTAQSKLTPVQGNNGGNSKYLPEFTLHPAKQRTCGRRDSVLHLFPGSFTLNFGYSLLSGWTD